MKRVPSVIATVEEEAIESIQHSATHLRSAVTTSSVTIQVSIAMVGAALTALAIYFVVAMAIAAYNDLL